MNIRQAEEADAAIVAELLDEATAWVGERGFEREIKKRLEYWEKLRQGTAATAQ